MPNKRAKGSKSKKKSISTGYYWDEHVDDLILEYQRTNDEELFTKEIYPVFVTASKSLMWDKKYPLMDQDDLNQIVHRMYRAIPRYNKSKGSGFSYFSVAGKREIIQMHMKKTNNENRYQPIHLNKYLEPDEGTRGDNPDSIQMPPALIAPEPDKRDMYKAHIQDFLKWVEPHLFKLLRKRNLIPQAQQLMKTLRKTECEGRKELHKEIKEDCEKAGITYCVGKTTKIKRILSYLYQQYKDNPDAIVIK